jgi:serine/threonine-protein kinase
MLPAVPDLLDALRPLLSHEQLHEAAALAATAQDARSLTAALVDRKALTPFQAQELNRGAGAGLLIGSYVLLARIGAGGMGEVFRARHVYMKRDVALKRVLPQWVSSPDAVARFRREVEAAAKLDHPNVVRVFDAGEAADGSHFLTMELLAGVNLGELMSRSGPLAVAEAAEYVRQACVGMQHVHEQGLVHRDIKPGNLMLTLQKQVKILDLGLAIIVQEAALTQTGAGYFGTIDYMAPEQVTDVKRVDIRADVYSLGCTLYHLLAGKTPFQDTHPLARPSMHLSQEPPPIEQVRPDVPPRLVAALLQMMAKARERRPQTPGAAAELLQAALGGGTAAPLAAPVTAQRAAPLPQSTARPAAAVTDTAAPMIDLGMTIEAGEASSSAPSLEVIGADDSGGGDGLDVLGLNEMHRQFAEQVKLRAYDDRYVDRAEEREILRWALDRGTPVEGAYAALAQVCEASGYVLESAALRPVEEALAVMAANDGMIDEKEFADAVALLGRQVQGKKTMLQLKRMVLELIRDHGYKVKTGLFSNWHARVKKEVGLA